MPLYKMRAPNGHVYEISGPPGATDDEIVAEILRQNPHAGDAAPDAKPDIAKIKRNVNKMIAQGAPESDIDAYIAEENLTVAELQNTKPDGSPRNAGSTRNVTVTFEDGSSHTYRGVPDTLKPEQVTERAEREFGQRVTHIDGGRKPASAGKGPHAPSPDARAIIQSVLPKAEITSWKRDPNSALGRANPSSWHSHSGGAVDIRPIPGMSYEDARKAIEDAGYPIIEARDEVHNPAPWATGPHWHFVIGQKASGDERQAEDAPDASPPSDPQAPSSGMGIGDLVAGRRTAPETGLLDKIADFGKGIGEGWQDVENGAAGLLLRGTDAIGLTEGSHDRFNRIENELRKPYQDSRYADPDGLSRSIGWGVGNLAASAPLAEIKPFQAAAEAAPLASKIGNLAAQGAAMGTVESAGNDVLEHAAIGAVAAPVLGVSAEKALGIAGSKLVDSRIGERLMPKIAQQRFEARQALNKYAGYDRQIAGDVATIVQNVTGKAPSKSLTKAQKVTLLDRVNELEASYLPYSDLKALSLPASAKARLRKAMDNRNLLSDDDIAALADGTPAGDAVADAIRKARRLRSSIPEVAGRSSPSAAKFLAEAFGGSLGFKLGGTIGGAAGTAAAKGLTRSSVTSAADRALEVAADAPRFARMPAEVFDAPGTLAQQALSKLADETRDSPFLAKQEAERLDAEGRKVAIANARDDVKPSGGWRGLIYERTGLLPSQQDAGALTALKDGHINPEQFDAFLNSPDKLMHGNAGNALTDRLASMADDGHLARDPNWTPPAAAPASDAAPVPRTDAQGQPIRSIEAYRAGAAKNIAREVPILQELDAINAERAAKYENDPDYAKIAGTDADPYVSRINSLHAALSAMKPSKGGTAK